MAECFIQMCFMSKGGKGGRWHIQPMQIAPVIGLPPTGSSGVLAAATAWLPRPQHGWCECECELDKVRIEPSPRAIAIAIVGIHMNCDPIFATSPTVVTVNAKGGPLVEPVDYISALIMILMIDQ